MLCMMLYLVQDSHYKRTMRTLILMRPAGGLDVNHHIEPKDMADLNFDTMTRDSVYRELELRGVETRPRDRTRAANLLRLTIIAQEQAERAGDAEIKLGLDTAGVDLSHPTLGMSDDELKEFLKKR